MKNLLNDNSEMEADSFSEFQTMADETPYSSSVFNRSRILAPLNQLMAYVQKRNYEGHDLFDGLNSRLFRYLPVYKSSYFRLALIQLCKKSPINLRSVFMVPEGFNPKGGALFLMGHLNLLRNTGKENNENEAYLLFQRLKRLAIPCKVGNAWGYNFDWQARAFFVPEGVPNLVTSVYVGRAMLEYYDQFGDPEALELALGVTDFILDEMIKDEDDSFLCFNYIPGKDAEVHNANLLGASYLAQTLAYFPKSRQTLIREKCLKSVRFSLLDIAADGSWPYGTKPFHRWVDNFHTAFNIESLIYITVHLQTDELLPVLEQITEYYLFNLFTEEGIPKYFNHQLYPIDIHVIAETIVLFQRLKKHQLLFYPERIAQIEQTLMSLLEAFQDKEGFFYYQKLPRGQWNRIPYIRWGQAWMFYALSSCL